MEKVDIKSVIVNKIKPAFFEYWYKATIESVYDGDSITVEFDYGRNHYEKHVKVRLLKINAPELRGIERENGLRIRDIVRELLPVGTRVWLNTYLDRDGKHGRLLAIVFVGEMNVNQWLLDHNFVDPYPKPKEPVAPPVAPPDIAAIYIEDSEEPIYTKDEDDDGTDGTPV